MQIWVIPWCRFNPHRICSSPDSLRLQVAIGNLGILELGNWIPGTFFALLTWWQESGDLTQGPPLNKPFWSSTSDTAFSDTLVQYWASAPDIHPGERGEPTVTYERLGFGNNRLEFVTSRKWPIISRESMEYTSDVIPTNWNITCNWLDMKRCDFRSTMSKNLLGEAYELGGGVGLRK